MRAKPSKAYVVGRIERMIEERGGRMSLLDLGCGRALNFEPLVRRHPGFVYTGVEPHGGTARAAADALAGNPNARIVNDLIPTGLVTGSFDVVASLSVLEHVKRLDRFLRFSVARTRPGGTLVHLYDLGHALTPSTLRERAHVWAGGVPALRAAVPARRFVSYVDEARVARVLRDAGAPVIEVTRHNLPGHVSLLKAMDESEEAHALLDRIVDLEAAAGARLAHQPRRVRERLLPAVCLWARRPAGG